MSSGTIKREMNEDSSVDENSTPKISRQEQQANNTSTRVKQEPVDEPTARENRWHPQALCNSQETAVEQETVEQEEQVTQPPNMAMQFSNQLKNVAHIQFNTELLNILRPFCDDQIGLLLNACVAGEEMGAVDNQREAVGDVCNMIEQRTMLIERAQHEYSLADQQNFNLALLEKLQFFEQPDVSTAVKIKLQEMASLLLSITHNLGQFDCPFFRFLPDLYLLKAIMNKTGSFTAKGVLRARKLRLRRMLFELKFGNISMRIDESILGDNSAGINDAAYRTFQYGMEYNKVDAAYMFQLFNNIVQLYDLSEAEITLRNHECANRTHNALLESAFGPPPSEHDGKICIKEMIVESSGVADFLKWFSPVILNISCHPKVVVETNCDPLMEYSKAGVIGLSGRIKWSDASVFRVLTDHKQNKEKGPRRTILYRCGKDDSGTSGRTIAKFREVFNSWSFAFEAMHGSTERTVTLVDNDIDTITITLD